MTIKTKRGIVLTVSWLAFMLMLSVVFGVDMGWSKVTALWWTVPCLAVWAGGLWKSGWLKI